MNNANLFKFYLEIVQFGLHLKALAEAIEAPESDAKKILILVLLIAIGFTSILADCLPD